MGSAVPDENDDDMAMDREFPGTSRWRPMSMDTFSDFHDSRRAKSAGTYRKPCTMSNEGIALSSPSPLYKHLNRGSSASATLCKNWDDLAKNKPRIWIKRNVNRPCYILENGDIKGARPNPKNMKLGKAARNTCPLTPEYVLPSYKEPAPYEPKFLRDSLRLDDIEGCRPMPLISDRERDHLTVRDIDGSTPGWKPRYRRNFGKNVRDLCLNVRDISPYRYRHVRDPGSEVYQAVEGSQPKQLIRTISKRSLLDTILRNDDIEGSTADSALPRSKLHARKLKSASRNIVSTQQEKAELVAVKLLKTKVLEQMRSKSAKEVLRVFKEMDRESSGKLSASEVESAFKNLDVGLNSAELKVFTTAFDTSFDGFLNYWQLVKHLVPVVPSKNRERPSKVSWQGDGLASDLERVRGDHYASAGLNEAREAQDLPAEGTGQEASTVLKESARNREAGSTPAEEADRKEHSTMRTSNKKDTSQSQSNLTRAAAQELKSRGRCAVLPIGGPFWPEEKALKALPESAKSYLSLFSDYHEPPNMSAFYKILDESEKRWVMKVGENVYTGEGKFVSSTSYSDGGNHWHPLPSPQKRTRPRPATTGILVRPSSSVSSRPTTNHAWQHQEQQEQQQRQRELEQRSQQQQQNLMPSARSIRRRPQSASSLLVRGSLSNNNVNNTTTNHRVHNPRIRVPHRVQAQLSQLIEDISAVKALR